MKSSKVPHKYLSTVLGQINVVTIHHCCDQQRLKDEEKQTPEISKHSVKAKDNCSLKHSDVNVSFRINSDVQCFKCATKHYKAHNALGHGSTFDLLFKQSGRSLLLSALQSTPRPENKWGFVLRPAPTLLSCMPPQHQGGPEEMCVSLPCPVAR